SSDTSEGTISDATVVFTTLDWNAPQTITITGVDDFIADGSQPYTIVTSAATSTDAAYMDLDAANVSVNNTDNDTAGITVFPVAGLTTTEAGGQATFTVVLNSQPSTNVTIGLTSNDTTEGTVSPASVIFTTANWNAPQTVTVTGVDDAAADGSQPYRILTAPAVSTDAGYSLRDAADVSLTNIDNDTAGITVTPLTLTTTEAGGAATFSIVLNSQPTADVTIALTSNDTTEGTVDPDSVTFTSLNWNAPQVVTVTGVDDAVADGNQPYRIVTAAAISADLDYATRDAADVNVSNTDNDTASITVSPNTGLTTTEAGGQATFTVVLNSQPTSDVTIGLTSSDTTEGTVSPASVVFTTANWNAPQTVTITGQNDAFVDGNQPYTIITAAAISADASYSNVNATNVSVTNTDNDTAGITVIPSAGLITSEAGLQATFTVVLNSQPSADVTIGLTSSDTTEGSISVTGVVFTTLNWNAPQTVTITGLNDAVVDGNQPYTIITAPATSTDAGYSNSNAADVGVTNVDNDSAGITVTPIAGLTTTEAGGQATFTVVLNSQPTANVTIAVSSSDATEGTASPANLVFTSVNWNAPQTVTVTGANDAIVDGNQPYLIRTAPAVSADPNYSTSNAADVSVTNTDNDTAGITVTPTSGLTTTESGGQATFTIVLNSQPSASVTVGLTSSATDEGTVGPASVTFTTANWNAPQTITVTGVNDAIADGNQPYTIVTSAAISADLNYQSRSADDVSVTNTDNDTAGITVTPTILTTTEAGGQATFTVVLNSQPTANVTIGLSSSDTAEGTVGPTSIVFTSVNWNAPQTITVTGEDDAAADGNQPYTIVTAAAVSTDAGY
ncbi:MAG: calcium-binding protein, partial [Deltaproteobacteria bacterium]|nr:calcium-binding protein [Deltaproteobacteria bacterium]